MTFGFLLNFRAYIFVLRSKSWWLVGIFWVGFGEIFEKVGQEVMMYQKCDSLGLQLLGMYATIRTPWKGVER